MYYFISSMRDSLGTAGVESFIILLLIFTCLLIIAAGVMQYIYYKKIREMFSGTKTASEKGIFKNGNKGLPEAASTAGEAKQAESISAEADIPSQKVPKAAFMETGSKNSSAEHTDVSETENLLSGNGTDIKMMHSDDVRKESSDESWNLMKEGYNKDDSDDESVMADMHPDTGTDGDTASAELKAAAETENIETGEAAGKVEDTAGEVKDIAGEVETPAEETVFLLHEETKNIIDEAFGTAPEGFADVKTENTGTEDFTGNGFFFGYDKETETETETEGFREIKTEEISGAAGTAVFDGENAPVKDAEEVIQTSEPMHMANKENSGDISNRDDVSETAADRNIGNSGKEYEDELNRLFGDPDISQTDMFADEESDDSIKQERAKALESFSDTIGAGSVYSEEIREAVAENEKMNADYFSTGVESRTGVESIIKTERNEGFYSSDKSEMKSEPYLFEGYIDNSEDGDYSFRDELRKAIEEAKLTSSNSWRDKNKSSDTENEDKNNI